MPNNPKLLIITPHLSLPDHEIELHAIRSRGAGGQNVNKVASAIHLRFDIRNSSLPAAVKQRLLASRDHRINKEGVLVIKAQRHRTQEQNRQEALDRLVDLVCIAATPRKNRIPTRPSRRARARRVDSKVRQGRIKQLRGKPDVSNGA